MVAPRFFLYPVAWPAADFATAINVGRMSPRPSLPRWPKVKYSLLYKGYRSSYTRCAESFGINARREGAREEAPVTHDQAHGHLFRRHKTSLREKAPRPRTVAA